MLSVETSMRFKRSTISGSLISRTPNGVNTDVFHYLVIEDLHNAETNVIEAFGAHVRTWVVFLKVVGFVGHDPTSSTMIDVLMHKARSTCTYCSF